MAITPKPERKAQPKQERNAVDVDALIRKCGSAPKTDAAAGKPKYIQLRLHPGQIAQIDKIRKTRTVPPSRHAWLLEAVAEKLQREGAKR